MIRTVGILGLLLLMTGVGSGAPHTKRPAPAASKKPVVTRLVRLDLMKHGPRPPVTITVAPGPVVSAGRQRIRIWVRPLVDAARVDVKIETRDGLGIAQGRSRWPALRLRGQATAEDVVLAASGPGERGLLVAATLTFADGTTMTAVEGLVLNPGPRPPAAVVPGTREVITTEGERILVAPLLPDR